MRTSVFSLLALGALTATLALPRTAPAAPVLKLHAEGFTAPTALVELPDGSGRFPAKIPIAVAAIDGIRRPQAIQAERLKNEGPRAR